MKLFCIPHAGGSSVAYRVWKKFLDEKIEFFPLDMPGHMNRSREPLCENINEVVLDFARTIKNNLNDNEKYAIYGHSMGGVILYFLYFQLLEHGCNPPTHLFFSSRWPPYHNNEKAYVDLDDLDEAKDRLIKMGGFKRELIDNKQLLDYYMKILLADYKLIQSVEISSPKKIFSDITAIWSDKEPDMLDDDIYEWKTCAGNGIAFVKIRGTHFFPVEEPVKTVEVVNKTLRKYI